MDKVKEYKRSKNFRNFYFTVYDYIKQGFNPAQIAKKTGKSKQALNHYIRQLRACKAISKVGYGVWNALDRDRINEVKIGKKYTVRTPSRFISSTVVNGEVRGHAFRFVVRLPVISGWELRREFLRRFQIRFKCIPYGESLEIRGHRVKVFSRSLDIYFNAGWSSFTGDAETAYSYAILELKHVLTRLENLLGIDIKRKRGYVFKVARQHYSLVKNALAKDYLKNKVKLKVSNPDGSLWFIIDNSYHLEEAEACHAEDARDDTKKVQDFFNGVKSTGITPDFILHSLDSLVKDRAYYAENLRDHVKAINELREGVNTFVKVVKDFKRW